LKGPSPLLNLAVVAISRLVLHNIGHVKAYWPMVGLESAALALSFGADDLDGTIGEERIAHAAGAPTPKALSRDRMVETIRLGGFEPRERDGEFNALKPVAEVRS
jgi:aminodeoxyfutalosine synthase